VGYIEYGNIENCKFDSDLKSKILRLVTSNLEACNIKFNIDFFNIDSKTGSNGGSNGVIASPIIISSHPPANLKSFNCNFFKCNYNLLNHEFVSRITQFSTNFTSRNPHHLWMIKTLIIAIPFK